MEHLHEPMRSASVYVRSTTTEPEQVTDELGLTPDFTHRRGEPRRPNQPEGERYAWHLWSMSPADATGTVEEQASALLQLLHERRDRVRALPADCQVELLLGVSSHSYGRLYVLEPSAIALMAELGLALHIDAYGDPGSDGAR